MERNSWRNIWCWKAAVGSVIIKNGNGNCFFTKFYVIGDSLHYINQNHNVKVEISYWWWKVIFTFYSRKVYRFIFNCVMNWEMDQNLLLSYLNYFLWLNLDLCCQYLYFLFFIYTLFTVEIFWSWTFENENLKFRSLLKRYWHDGEIWLANLKSFKTLLVTIIYRFVVMSVCFGFGPIFGFLCVIQQQPYSILPSWASSTSLDFRKLLLTLQKLLVSMTKVLTISIICCKELCW